MEPIEESRSLNLSDDTSSQSYHLLEKYPQSLLGSFIPREQHSRCFHNSMVITLLYVAIIWLSASLMYLVYRPTRCSDPSQGIYSPTQGAIHYMTKVFPENFENKGPYMGSPESGLPTDETDALWEDLYQFGISSISGAEATDLPNKTSAVPNQTDEFVIELDVFHQLHCLNSLRKSLYLERYVDEIGDLYDTNGRRNYTSTAIRHWDHCVDSIRQSIMCHGDVATVYWRWVWQRQIPLPNMSTTRTCRDFEALKAWGKEHVIADDENYLQWQPGPEADIHLSP